MSDSLIESIQKRDPARPSFLEVMFAYNGFHAVCLHRVSQWIWDLKLRALARFIANITRMLTGIEIHPQARIGERLFIDHGTGVVIGQTAMIGNDVTLYHGVTLGGKGEPDQTGKRHPTVLDGAVIGAGAQILGNITIGKDARVGANAVVTKPVPDGETAVGNPARLVRCNKEDIGRAYGLPREVNDPYAAAIKDLIRDVTALKEKAGITDNKK